MGGRRRQPWQVELDFVVEQEGHDLGGMLRLLDRLVPEDLCPFAQALPGEVKGSTEVGLMGAELCGDLSD